MSSHLISAARFLALLALAPIFAATPGRAATRAPDWLAPVAAGKPTFDYGKAPVAVLLDDGVIEVDRSGTFTRRSRHAVRILTAEGKEGARVRATYDAGSEKVRSLQAWLILPSGEVKTYTKKQAVDAIIFGNARELYSEARQLLLLAKDDAVVDAVFAFESIIEEKSVNAETVWFFQDETPVEESTFTLNLPEGWSAESRLFNHDPVAPTGTDRNPTWALRQLPAAEPEPGGPPREALAAWLAVSIRPPAGAKAVTRQPYRTWPEVARRFAPLYDEAARPDPAIQAKAAALTAGANSSWERIRLLCRYAQQANYIAISLNAAEAGGYIPRPASRVLPCNYGDCKDKTTLLRALLRSVNVESYPLVLFSGDASHVRPEWPSPLQFNHCIIAIKVDDSIADTGAILVHSRHGRLLLFDPTNEYLPPGLLPREDLGGRGLLLAATDDGLGNLPGGRSQDNRVERQIVASIGPEGSIDGTFAERRSGLASVAARKEHIGNSESEYRTIVERWLASSLPAARAPNVEVHDNFDGADFAVNVAFRGSSYGKPMRDTLLVFKPAIFARHAPLRLKKGKRTQPVIVEPVSFTEQSTFTLPAGYRIDEPYPPVELKVPFGHYRASARSEADGRLQFERSLELDDTTVPVTDYEVVRSFLEKVHQAEQTPVVLRRE